MVANPLDDYRPARAGRRCRATAGVVLLDPNIGLQELPDDVDIGERVLCVEGFTQCSAGAIHP